MYTQIFGTGLMLSSSSADSERQSTVVMNLTENDDLKYLSCGRRDRSPDSRKVRVLG